MAVDVNEVNHRRMHPAVRVVSRPSCIIQPAGGRPALCLLCQLGSSLAGWAGLGWHGDSRPRLSLSNNSSIIYCPHSKTHVDR